MADIAERRASRPLGAVRLISDGLACEFERTKLKGNKMTPAALNALISGDMDNFIAASTPGGIEAQEKGGQIEQSFAETLPVDMGEHRAEFEKLGFVFGKADELFIDAKFPTGWRKRPTDHSMWTDILDDKGRKRGMIFYKAAFYDRRAHAHLERRFRIGNDYEKPQCRVFVEDACNLVNEGISGVERSNYKAIDAAEDELKKWLDKHYPDWHSPMAYWDATEAR